MQAWDFVTQTLPVTGYLIPIPISDIFPFRGDYARCRGYGPFYSLWFPDNEDYYRVLARR